MRLGFLLFVILAFPLTLRAQEIIDKTRLEFDDDQIISRQVGMAVSQDRNYAAFALDNGQVRIMDLRSSKFARTLRVDFLVLNEIAFTQDGKGLIVIEPKRFRVINWKEEEVILEKDTYELIRSMAVAKTSNHFGIVIKNIVEVWDVDNLSLQSSVQFKKPANRLSFSPQDNHLIINPDYRVFKPSFLIYDYLSGEEIREYRKMYRAFYDDLSDKAFVYRDRPFQTAISVPTFRHTSLTDLEDYVELFIYGIVDGKSTTGYDDVGHHVTTIRVKDKVLAAGAGYSGFNVFDIKEGGKVFTTQSTYRARSSSAASLRKYQINTHYRLSDDLILINAYGDNINQIYSADQNAIIGYIFVDADRSYAVVSRDGRFDGSEDASEKLYWSTRKKANKTKLASTFSQRFSPGLLRSLIHGKEIVAELDIDEEIDALPSVELVSVNGQTPGSSNIPSFTVSNKKAQIQIRVSENLPQTEEIKLFQNNKLVGVVSDPESENTLTVNLTNSFGEENYFYFTASSKKKMDTDKQKFIIRYTGKTDEKPRMYILTVGVNEYKNPRYNLNYAIADANGFRETLSDGASSIFDEIRDYTIRDSEFTKDKLLSVFSEIQESANEQDLFVFYYAGHGVMGEGSDGPNDFFLAPHDITQLYGRDDLLQEKGISASELREISKNINAQKQLFILDACQSAAALDAMASRGVSEERAIAQLARSTGTFWITAAGSEQFATEFESLGHGVFTYVLLEGLKGGADGANPDQRITVRELSAYLESRVPELSEQYKGKPQYPAGYSFGNDFPVVIYK